jgi:UDP-glucuronate 4-epimerase
MNILITGASGFIGFHLSRSLLRDHKDWKIVGVDNLNAYYDVNLKLARLQKLKDFKNFEFHNIDISKSDNFKNLPTNFNLIINLAAQAGVRIEDSNHYKYISSNISGFLNVIMFANRSNIKNIIYASSSSVYSGLPSNINIFKENQKLEIPNSMYAISKLTNEMQADLYSKRFGISFVGLRFFTVYGDYGRPDMAYFSFSNSLLSNQEITLFNDGEMSRDMTHVSDIVNGIVASIKYISTNENVNEIFNLGNNKPVMTKYLLEMIAGGLNIDPVIKNEVSINEVLHTHADLTKSNRILDYYPEVNIENGIEMFLEWFKINKY